MRIKYVASKSKFIDLDARRPRLMKLETVVSMLQACGTTDVSGTIRAIMEQPIELDQPRKRSKQYDILKQFQVVNQGEHYYVLGLKFDLYQASQYLIQKGVSRADSLRVLALSIDIAPENK